MKILFSTIAFCLLLLWAMVASIHAQTADTDSLACEHSQTESKAKKKKHRGIYNFFKSFNTIDTTYIEPNHYNFTAMAQGSNLMNFYTLYGKNENGKRQRISFNTEPRLKVGPYIGWHWLFLGYQFDIGRTYTSKHSQQYNLSLYSSFMGVDYIHNKNNGDFTINRVKGFGKETDSEVKDMAFGGLDVYTHSLSAYYIFNHKRFSYPAAFSQSTQQKKSCGSLIAGIIYSHQKLKFDYTKLPARMLSEGNGGTAIYDELKFEKINFYDYSLSLGYAYNWVFTKNLLLSISASPAIGYKFSKGQNIDHKQLFSSHNLNFDVIGRTGIVWNTNRYFAGISGTLHAYTYHKSRFRLSNAIALANLYVGINFMPKGHYRRKYPQKFKKW